MSAEAQGPGSTGPTGDDRPTLVFGLVGALGTDLPRVADALAQALRNVNYRVEEVRVSDLITEEFSTLSLTLAGEDAEPEIRAKMARGDALREHRDDNAVAAARAIAQITASSCQQTDGPQPRAFVIRSLKRPEEVEELRDTYGSSFVLVGADAPPGEREKNVEARLRTDHRGKAADWYAQQVAYLVLRDEHDAATKDHGQDVRGTFELADAYLEVRSGIDCYPGAERLVRLLFGAPYETPTRHEQAMFHCPAPRFSVHP